MSIGPLEKTSLISLLYISPFNMIFLNNLIKYFLPSDLLAILIIVTLFIYLS